MPKMINKKRKMLIIGGTGFIGYHLAKLALKKNWEVDSISRRFPQKRRKIQKVKYFICDITKPKDIKKKINNNYSFVINLGGDVDHKNKIKTYKSHFLGCKNLSNFFLHKNIDTFVQIGSSAEYATAKSPQDEDLICKPKSYYGKSKYLATNHLLNMFKITNFPAVILRLYQTFGPAQDTNRLIPFVINSCLKGKNFPCSNGNQFRDFLFIEDVVSSILKCYKNEKSYGQIINIGSGKPIKVKYLIEYIKDIIKNGKPNYGEIKLRKEENYKTYPKIIKARKLLNWRPNINFKSSLSKTISYYKKNET